MTETTGPDVLTPDASDKKTRRDQGPPADPEAPYGWMNDPKTGERRPKKRPGRQKNNVSAPPTRPNNKARTEPPPAAAAGDGDKLRDYSGPVSELCQGVWMLLASVPDTKIKFGKIDLAEISIKAKAQASILKENGDGVIKGTNMIAQHNPGFRRALDKLSEETGPMWALPAMFLLMPFVGQSLALWRAPVAGDVTLLAKKTEKEFDDLMNATMRQAAADQAAYEEAMRDMEAADINERAS